MSTAVLVRVEVTCDERRGCRSRATAQGTSVHAATATLTAAGWLVRAGFAACPEHNVNRAAGVTRG